MFRGRHQNLLQKFVRSKILQSFDHQRNTSFADWIYSHAILAILELQKVQENDERKMFRQQYARLFIIIYGSMGIFFSIEMVEW